MALKKITEQATNDYPKKSAYVLVTQNDADSQGIIKESLRRVPMTLTPAKAVNNGTTGGSTGTPTAQ